MLRGKSSGCGIVEIEYVAVSVEKAKLKEKLNGVSEIGVGSWSSRTDGEAAADA